MHSKVDKGALPMLAKIYQHSLNEVQSFSSRHYENRIMQNQPIRLGKTQPNLFKRFGLMIGTSNFWATPSPSSSASGKKTLVLMQLTLQTAPCSLSFSFMTRFVRIELVLAPSTSWVVQHVPRGSGKKNSQFFQTILSFGARIGLKILKCWKVILGVYSRIPSHVSFFG